MNLTLDKKITLLGLAALLGLALYHIFTPFWTPLAWAIILAFLLLPLQRRLTIACHGKAGLAAGVITAATPVVIVGPLAMLSTVFAHQMAVLLEQLRLTQLRLDEELIAKVGQWPILGAPVQWLHATLPEATEHAWLKSGAETALGTAAAASRDFMIAAGSRFVEFGLALFLLFFLLRDGRKLLGRLLPFIPLESEDRRALLELVGRTTRAVVYGSGVTSLVQGAMVGIGFAVTGLPAPVVFGSVAAVLSLLPAGGAGLVWVPGVIALFVEGKLGWALALGVWGLIISVSDNLLRPFLISSGAPVSALMVFIGAIGGASAFGMIGLILGPVLLSVIAAMVRYIEERRNTDVEGLPARTLVTPAQRANGE